MLYFTKDKTMSIKERLKQTLELHNIRQSDFCRRLKVSSGYISAMRDGISFEKLSLIAKYFPEIDLRSLLTGKIEPASQTVYQKSWRRVYLYESALDLEELHDNQIKNKALQNEIESLKQTIQKQEKIITRLKNKKQKAKD